MVLLNNLCEQLTEEGKNIQLNKVPIKLEPMKEGKEQNNNNKFTIETKNGYEDKVLSKRDKARNMKGIEYIGFSENVPNFKVNPVEGLNIPPPRY